MSSIEVFTLIAGLIGGLALFLYGMNEMSGALTKAAGGKLESTLSKITSNKLIAYLFGVGVTALVQSSSASTVMVVGLVNSGIMSLKEAVNVILGANLGTTYTAWLLSLNAISSDNFIINLLKPTSFTPFLAIIGSAILMFSHNDKKKNIGSILMGFSILMFGMSMMSSAVAPLKSVPEFTDFLTRFSNPILGFLVGTLFTMIIQSSAGTIGVVQALSLSVAINYSVALPIVIGAEVGTCITAMLSSLGANKNGKRAALMHLYFNLIKALSFMIIFYSLNAVFHFSFLQIQAGMVGIATIHTLVNLVSTPLMLPFSGILVKLATATIPYDEREQKEMEERKEILILDPMFLSNPAFALEQSRQATVDMALYTQESLLKAISIVNNYDETVAEDVSKLEKKVDKYEDELGTYLVKISSHHLSTDNSHLLSILLHTISDFERISDHALNIMQIAERMHANGRSFSPKAQEELKVLSDAVSEIVDISVKAFKDNDLNLAKTVEPLEEVIDGIHMEVKRRHVRRLRKGKCTIEHGFDLTDIGTDFERISDHCSNIAVCLLQVSEDGFDTHEYLEMLKQEKNTAFEESVELYERKYTLPKLKKNEEDEEDNIDSSFAAEHPLLVSDKAESQKNNKSTKVIGKKESGKKESEKDSKKSKDKKPKDKKIKKKDK